MFTEFSTAHNNVCATNKIPYLHQIGQKFSLTMKVYTSVNLSWFSMLEFQCCSTKNNFLLTAMELMLPFLLISVNA